MNPPDRLTEALMETYQQAGEETGYWGHRFRQALLRSGGLVTAKRMLKPRTKDQRKGLDALLDAGHPELTLEAVVLRAEFANLFSRAELSVAVERLEEYGAEAGRRLKNRERLYPDDLDPGPKYFAGARKQVRVNAYERDPRARAACLKHYGCRCSVCNFSFEEAYGDVGRGFIHVHHLKPLALTSETYELHPVDDLRPVCPNCHAMLHKSNPIATIEELRSWLTSKGSVS